MYIYIFIGIGILEKKDTTISVYQQVGLYDPRLPGICVSQLVELKFKEFTVPGSKSEPSKHGLRLQCLRR